MRKMFFVTIIVLLVNTGLVFAHGHNFFETKQLIDSGIGCEKLTDEQLESIGDYYMEQMHPGEAHEMMDKMMGGEGSENLRQVHITMAKRLYCNEDIGGMMGSGVMMGMMNMMGDWRSFGYGWNILSTLYVILIVGLIILTYLAIIKLWKDSRKTRGK